MTGFVPPGPGQPPEGEPTGSPPNQQPLPPYPTYPQLPQYPQQPRYDGGADAEAGSSRKMAGWALGLSFMFCIPMAPIVAIGLAITALVQGSRATRDGRTRNHGTGMAIAALPIALVSLVAAIALVVLDVRDEFDTDDDPERDETTGEVTEGGDLLPAKLRVGDCFNEPELAGLGATEQIEVDLVDVVHCATTHDAEVYHSFQLSGETYPGQATIDQEAHACVREFKEFVGLPYTRSKLDFVYYFPTEASWDFLDDRGIVCTVYDPVGGPVTGSLENSRR